MTTAVFLGAGASKAFGHPLTTEILPCILRRADEGTLFARRSANAHARTADNLAWFRPRLRAFFPGLHDLIAKNESPGISVTDLLTLVDRALAHGEARVGMSFDEVSRFRALLEQAIYEAIMRETTRRKKPQQLALNRFAGWLESLPSPASVITTNYDMAVDSRIVGMVGRRDRRKWSDRVGEAVDFGFAWRRNDTGDLVPRPAQPRWRLYKLHGSVGWLSCPLCGQITQSVRGAIGSKAFAPTANEWNTCHCSSGARLRLHLVTPSLIRTYQDPHLLGIWQAALETLRTAAHWVIMGYSLPAEDVAIRSLLLRAWDAHALSAKPHVTVVQRKNPNEKDPDKKSPTEMIYRSFFPSSNLTYRTDGMEGFIASLSGNAHDAEAS